MDNEFTLDNNEIENAIEAILFAAGHPMPYDKLAEVLGYGEGTIRKKVASLADTYNNDKSKGIISKEILYRDF